MVEVASHHEPAARALMGRALTAWAEADSARALHPADHDVVRSTEAARSLVLDLFDASAPARDLFNACARLGRLMAEAGGSPSLVAGAIDSAVQALSDAGLPCDERRIGPARASLLEGYVAVVRERERATALASWEYPSCVVPIDDDAVAVACGYPTDDAEPLTEWASRIAGKLVKAKTRRVRLSGSPEAVAEVESAVTLVGITVVPRDRDTTDPRKAPTVPPAASGRSWFRLPWRK